MPKRKSTDTGTATGTRWVERLRLDHRRARALLRLINEQLDEQSFPLVERVLITRDVMTYMHRYFDPAHHAIEGLLLRIVQGQDRAFDKQVAVLDDQHLLAIEDGEKILAALDGAIAENEAEACFDALRRTAEYSDRLLDHLEYEDDYVFTKLEQLLRNVQSETLPNSVSDPLFEQQLSDEYAALQRHSLQRVEHARKRRARADDPG